MTRRLPVPDHCRTTLPLRVRFYETDAMGIVHHSNYLRFFEAGRIEYLARRRVSYRELSESGVHMPVVDASLSYKSPARFDDLLAIETWLDDFTRVTATFAYRVTIAESESQRVVAVGTTRLACVNREHRPTRLPETLVEQLLGPERPR